jgi:hypothetical protein
MDRLEGKGRDKELAAYCERRLRELKRQPKESVDPLYPMSMTEILERIRKKK